MSDGSLLPQQVIEFLTPFLPYSIKAAKIGGTKAVEKMREKVYEESLAQVSSSEKISLTKSE